MTDDSLHEKGARGPQVAEVKVGAGGKRFDLEERMARFGEAIVRFARSTDVNPVTRPVIGQLVRAATSVGANYCEADDAGSRKEFR
jgi:hypothetical protein